MKIKQIVAANPGWFATFTDWQEPIAVWALVEDDDGHASTVGVSAGDELGLDHLHFGTVGFLGYVYKPT